MKQPALFSVDDIESRNGLIFKSIFGSRCFGTHNPDSDTDIRGLFILPRNWRLSLYARQDEVANKKEDIKFYELEKFVLLAKESNPSIIDLLWTPQDCILHMSPPMERLWEIRRSFITQRAFRAFSGYAQSQIIKAKGQNKMVHDEGRYEPGIARLQHWCNNGSIDEAWLTKHFEAAVCMSVWKGCRQDYIGVNSERADDVLLNDPDVLRLQRPKREAFCWFIRTTRSRFLHDIKTRFVRYMGENKWPVRPEPLAKAGIDLSKYHAAALEHIEGLYRLYYYGDESRGVFRDDGLPVLESIPIEHEWSRFRGLLLYNDNAYKTAVKDWGRYFEWRANRNETRWHGKDGTNFDFDHKNMMHCLRTLLCSENILKHGEPLVRFEGEQLEYLRNIRAGRFVYKDIISDVEQRMCALEELFKKTALPENPDLQTINDCYMNMLDDWERGTKG